MPTPAIIARVRELEAELAETPDFPSSIQPDVDAIKQQIATIMLEPDKVALYTSLNDRLLLAYIGFEIDHPKLAAAMQNAMAAIAGAGI